MDEKKKKLSKLKEGVSVQELESFAKKHSHEVFLILSILIATISGVFKFFTGPGWSLTFAGFGAILTIAFPSKIIVFQKKILKLILKQEKGVLIAIGVVNIIIAIFIPFIFFGILGMFAGSSYNQFIRDFQMEKPIKPEEEKPSKESEEEHL